jgi:hypothetical protein
MSIFNSPTLFSVFTSIVVGSFPGTRKWTLSRTHALVARAAENGVKHVTSDDPYSVNQTRLMKSAHKWVDATSGSGQVNPGGVNMNGPAVERTAANAMPKTHWYNYALPADCSLALDDRDPWFGLRFDVGYVPSGGAAGYPV